MNSRRMFRIIVGWSVFVGVFVAVAWMMSEGEPVCEGPLILEASDSYPPECPGPMSALPDVAQYYVAGIWLIMLGVAVQSRLRGARTPSATQSD